MSVDRTLHIRSGGTMKRNVLSRSERIAMLAEAGDFDPEQASPLGLRKTRVRVSKAGTKSKKEEKPAEGVPAEGAAAEGAPKAEGKAPAKGEAKPGKGEAKPGKGEAKPGKGEAKPGKGEAKPGGKGGKRG